MSFISYPPTNTFTQFIKALRRLTSPNVGLEDQDGVPSTGRDDGIASLYRRVTLFGTVKLHGSNITVVIEPSTVLSPQFQSRNRIITRETDHCDAVATLSRISWSILVDEILRICGTSTFREIFICGEWAGTGIQKGVAVSLLPRFFAIFNIRIDDQWVDMRKFATVHAPQERVYNVVNFQTFEVQVDFLEEANGERAYERMMQYTAEVVENCPIGIELLKSMEVPAKWLARQVTTGEGIVWTVVEPTTGPTLLNFKTKGEQFLATQSSKSVVSIEGDTIGPTGRARAFVDFALGERRFEQGIEYLFEMGKDPDKFENVGVFISWVIKDVRKEEEWRLGEKDESGRSPYDYGVTNGMVKKMVSGRAKAWFMKRIEHEVDAGVTNQS